jgi:phosphate transport system permease protein
MSGWAAIAVLAAIAAFLAVNALPAVRTYGLLRMIAGADWYPTSTPPRLGFLPAETGSLWITAVAVALAVPVGVMAAVFISEFTTGRLKEASKSLVEFMAAVPSVVYGLVGVAVLAPAVRGAFALQTGLTALAAGAEVIFMSLPTIVSIAEDALHAVPTDLRQGSLALGNTRWQTVYKVVVPSAGSGIFAT